MTGSVNGLRVPEKSKPHQKILNLLQECTLVLCLNLQAPVLTLNECDVFAYGLSESAVKRKLKCQKRLMTHIQMNLVRGN